MCEVIIVIVGFSCQRVLLNQQLFCACFIEIVAYSYQSREGASKLKFIFELMIGGLEKLWK